MFLTTLAMAQGSKLVNYLPKSYVKDGSVDYTDYLQKGLKENKEVEFPNFPVMINKKGLEVSSNQTLNFPPKAVLVMKPNAEEKYGMLNIKYVQNVVINNAVLKGDKEKHLSDKGEWGMGINIFSSSNITINNPSISGTWGDGIYIGEPKAAEKKTKKLSSYTNKNIVVKGGVIDNCLRNGISIISGIGITVDGTTIQNMNGKAPKGAVDIEPNGASNELKNIVLKNITTKNNFNGIIVFLVKLAQDKSYNINTITIENHKDYKSSNPLVIRNYHKKFKDQKNLKPVSGKIILKDLYYYDSKNGYDHHPDIKFNPLIEFSNVNFLKTANGKSVKDEKNIQKFKSTVKADQNVKLK